MGFLIEEIIFFPTPGIVISSLSLASKTAQGFPLKADNKFLAVIGPIPEIPFNNKKASEMLSFKNEVN